MPPPETFVYIKTHHSTIPNYVCVDKIPANFHPPPPTSTARKPVKTANVLFYWLTRPPPSPPCSPGTLVTPSMSKSDFGQISAAAYPLRRACPHTCPPSHTRPPELTLTTQIVIFWEKNLRTQTRCLEENEEKHERDLL